MSLHFVYDKIIAKNANRSSRSGINLKEKYFYQLDS
jgi:hypothetical protein